MGMGADLGAPLVEELDFQAGFDPRDYQLNSAYILNPSTLGRRNGACLLSTNTSYVVFFDGI